MTEPVCRNCQRPRSEHSTAYGDNDVLLLCPTAQFEAGAQAPPYPFHEQGCPHVADQSNRCTCYDRPRGGYKPTSVYP
jgi:hypothetical protein